MPHVRHERSVAPVDGMPLCVAALAATCLRRQCRMCGIFGYVGARNDAPGLVLHGLKQLEYRGYDSWGVAVPHAGSIVVEKRTGKIGLAETSLPGSTVGLGHTRWATHGGVTDENAHPHLDCTGRLAIIHNGIVQNHRDLRRELQDRGHAF